MHCLRQRAYQPLYIVPAQFYIPGYATAFKAETYSLTTFHFLIYELCCMLCTSYIQRWYELCCTSYIQRWYELCCTSYIQRWYELCCTSYIQRYELCCTSYIQRYELCCMLSHCAPLASRGPYQSNSTNLTLPLLLNVSVDHAGIIEVPDQVPSSLLPLLFHPSLPAFFPPLPPPLLLFPLPTPPLLSLSLPLLSPQWKC